MWIRLTAPRGFGAINYGPCELRAEVDGARVRIEPTTSYPFEEEIRFTVRTSGPVRFPLYLRRPAWAASFELSGLETESQADDQEVGYLRVETQWRGEACFTLRIGMQTRLEDYPDGSVAVFHGPLRLEPLGTAPLRHAAFVRPSP